MSEREADRNLASRYREYYERASVIPQQEDGEEVERFAALVPAKQPLKILDLGCAEGGLSVSLARRGHRVTAADISQAQVDKVHRAAQEAGVGLETAVLDIEAGTGGLSPGSFDVIYFMDVIEHLQNPVQALLHIRSLLGPRGMLILHTPNCTSVFRLLRYVLRPRKLVNYYDPRHLSDLHFQTYDYMTLEKTLNFTGLKIKRLVPTTLTLLPRLRLRRAARWFPMLSDTLLCICRLAPPLDVEKQIEHWRRTRVSP